MNNANFVRILGVMGSLLAGCGSESDVGAPRPHPLRGIEGTGVRSQGIQGTGFRTQGIQGSGRAATPENTTVEGAGEAGAGADREQAE